MALYLAIDQGSHATRALAIDEAGKVADLAFVDIRTHREASDQVEHDAREVAASVQVACRLLLDRLGQDRERLVAAGLATQRSSIVCWDSTSGEPLSPVLSWRDRRAADHIERLAAQSELVSRLTGLVLSPHYGASKIRWCLDNLQEVRRAHAAGRLTIGPLSSFLTHTLLGDARAIVDPANASRTLLWDRRKRQFSTRLCQLFGIDPGVLPATVPSRYDFGSLSIDGTQLPLRVVTGDQSAALFAFGRPDADIAYVNIGTGAFFQRTVGGRPLLIPGLLNSAVWHDGDDLEYVVEGTVNGAASALHEFAAGRGDDAHALVARATGQATAQDPLPLFINGVGGLAAPYWLPGFVSEFVGKGNTDQQLLAILESIAFLLGVNLRQSELRLPAAKRLVVSGGLGRVDYLCQSLADVSATPVARAQEEEATSQGLIFLTAGRPENWPAAHIQREFLPRANSPVLQRFAHWRDEMSARGATPPVSARD